MPLRRVHRVLLCESSGTTSRRMTILPVVCTPPPRHVQHPPRNQTRTVPIKYPHHVQRRPHPRLSRKETLQLELLQVVTCPAAMALPHRPAPAETEHDRLCLAVRFLSLCPNRTAALGTMGAWARGACPVRRCWAGWRAPTHILPFLVLGCRVPCWGIGVW